jgi:hypothetical protein
MSDPVMVDLNRYLSAQEQALDEEEQLELEKNRELKREVSAILNSDISDKVSKIVSLIEFEILEAKDALH